MRRAFGLLGLDARITGNAQLGFDDRHAEGAIDGFVQRLVASLVAILLTHDVRRYLARTEARQLDVLAQRRASTSLSGRQWPPTGRAALKVRSGRLLGVGVSAFVCIGKS